MTERRKAIDPIAATLGGAQQQNKKPASKPKGTKPATWRVGDEIIGRVNEAAGKHNVEKSGMVRILLSFALDALDSGDIDVDSFISSGPRKVDV